MSDFALLRWATERTRGHDNVDPADNLKECWGNGLTWCALLYAYFPEKIPLPTMKPCANEEEHTAAVKIAFDVATAAGCEPYLDPEDVVVVQDKKSIMVYLSEIYNITRDMPVKFRSSAEWEKKWDERQKAEQMARIRAKMEADRAGTPAPLAVSSPGGRKQSLAEKMAAKRAEEEAREKEEQEALRNKLAGQTISDTTAAAPAVDESAAVRAAQERQEKERLEKQKQDAERKAKEEKEKADRLAKQKEEETKKAQAAAPAIVSTGPVSGTLAYTVSGTGAKGGPHKKLIIFTVTFTIDGKKYDGTKDDLIVYVDGPSSPVPRTNIMGGSNGAFHIGFTPSEAGQHWIDFVFKGNWSAEPFCLPIKDNFNKTPDFPYTGKERNSK